MRGSALSVRRLWRRPRNGFRSYTQEARSGLELLRASCKGGFDTLQAAICGLKSQLGVDTYGAMDKLMADTQISRPGITSVVISHDMKAVLHFADKVVMLVDGVVAHEGTPRYFEQSDDPLVRQFMEGSLDGPMKV